MKTKSVCLRVTRNYLRLHLVPMSTGSIDFIHGTLVNGQKFSELNALEDFSREWLGIEVYKSARSMSSAGLERIVAKLRMNSGPKMISVPLDA